jgi:ABC-type polysaccharide/polyol phosphate transport system ATPase subunit
VSEPGDPMAIQVRDLGKKYLLRTAHDRTVKSTVLDSLRGKRAPRREFWALREVSFSVPRGETLGIVGANGAGKSTLLALLAGTKASTEGSIQTQGKMSSLLELGAGFHPELTGRENVFLAGAIMGLSRARMAERFDAIVDFAELTDFIDQPVKHYSSGMYVRLGFAVAVEVDPDILLLDEVLAVGDSSFQQKCLDRIDAFRRAGKTMLLISHDMETIRAVSNRILFLEEGRIQGLGNPAEIVGQYTDRAHSRTAEGLSREWGTGEITLTDVEILGEDGVATDRFRFGDGLTARIHYACTRRIENPVFGFSLADSRGRPLYGNNTQIENVEIREVEGKGTLELRLSQLIVGQGTYLLSFSAHSSDHQVNYHRLDHCYPIHVTAEKRFEGCYMPVQWHV